MPGRSQTVTLTGGGQSNTVIFTFTTGVANQNGGNIDMRIALSNPTQATLGTPNMLDRTLTVNSPAGGGGEGECEPVLCDSGCVWSAYECRCVGSGCESPILVDVSGNGIALTDAENGVYFDIDINTTRDRIAWTVENSDDAFLALDRDGNGRIGDGGELFGNFTAQPPSSSRNGFLALAEFDKPANGGNADGKISDKDSIFPSLRLWQDKNHNGTSEDDELHTLASLGLASIELDYKEAKRRDRYGNLFRYRAKVYDARGASLGRWAWDVFLTH
jgi:hypothetical protein